MVQKRKESEANAKVQGGQRSGSKPPPPVPNGLRLAEEERQLRADVAALSDEIVALNKEEDALTLQASKLSPPAPKKKGVGAGAKKPNTILAGKDKPPPPKGFDTSSGSQGYTQHSLLSSSACERRSKSGS